VVTASNDEIKDRFGEFSTRITITLTRETDSHTSMYAIKNLVDRYGSHVAIVSSGRVNCELGVRKSLGLVGVSEIMRVLECM
jgi:hypothetical protein